MANEAKEMLDTVNSGLEAGNKALDLYSRVEEQVIPWKKFDGILKEMEQHEKDYSAEAGALVGKAKTLLMNSRDNYLKATQSVVEWCSTATELIPAYLSLLDEGGDASVESQKEILINFFDLGEQRMTDAQGALQESSMSFNDASGQLSTLTTQLDSDFKTDSKYFRGRIDDIRAEAYGGAAAGAVAGPFGLILSYSIAAGVVEGKLIPELQEGLAQVRETIVDMKELASGATREIQTAKQEIQVEVKSVGAVKSQLQSTEVLVKFVSQKVEMVRKSAEKLISKCSTYLERHGVE